MPRAAGLEPLAPTAGSDSEKSYFNTSFSSSATTFSQMADFRALFHEKVKANLNQAGVLTYPNVSAFLSSKNFGTFSRMHPTLWQEGTFHWRICPWNRYSGANLTNTVASLAVNNTRIGPLLATISLRQLEPEIFRKFQLYRWAQLNLWKRSLVLAHSNYYYPLLTYNP